MTPPAPPTARTLSEQEIHDRLYGSYFGKPKTHSSASADSVWTGSEILTGELKRLRSELISLRQEKERLALRLERTGPSVGGWIGKIFGFLLLVGLFGYLSSAALQASPSRGDFTPYTVQVAVYNGRTMADQAQKLLEGLGYPAFVAATHRGSRGPQYRVYVGSFVTKEEAARESRRLEADTRFRDFKDAFVLIR